MKSTSRERMRPQRASKTPIKRVKWYVSISPQRKGEHEVHTATCSLLPTLANRQYLGTFLSCLTAVDTARRLYRDVNACNVCAPNCHKH